MIDSQRTLSAALNDLADHAPTRPAPTGELLRRGRRRRHARTAVTSVAAVTGVGVLAALTTGGAHTAASSDSAAAGSHSPVTLSLAAESTAASPFHFTATSKSTETPGGWGGAQTRTSSATGAFDPLTEHGYVKSSGGMTNAETIQIGDTCYAQAATDAPWLIVPCPSTGDPTIAGFPQNPAAVLKMLEADGQATNTGQSGSGSDALEMWKFTITQKPQTSAGRIEIGYTVNGTASVGVDSGRVAAVQYTLTLDSGGSGPTLPADTVTDESIIFSDYGAPVSVSAPVAGSTAANAQ